MSKVIKDKMDFKHPAVGRVFEFIGDETTVFWIKGLKMRVEWVYNGDYCCMPLPSIGHCLSCSHKPDQFKEITEYTEQELINWPKSEPIDKFEFERTFTKISTSDFLKKYSNKNK